MKLSEMLEQFWLLESNPNRMSSGGYYYEPSAKAMGYAKEIILKLQAQNKIMREALEEVVRHSDDSCLSAGKALAKCQEIEES